MPPASARNLRRDTFLAVIRLADLLACESSRLLAPEGLTGPQYNILRILRGAKGEALPCGVVGQRMLTPVPDLTRVLDKLESRALVERHRDAEDRRVVRLRITDAGLKLLEKLDRPMDELHERQLSGLSDRQTEQLRKLADLAQQR